MYCIAFLKAEHDAYLSAFERKQANLALLANKLKSFDTIQVFTLYKDKQQIDCFFAERDLLVSGVKELSSDLSKLDTALKLIKEELRLLS